MSKPHRNGRRVDRKSSSCPRHLYIVMNAWKDRYGIRKFDLSSDSGDHAAAVHRPLPPALIRFQSLSSGFFVATGTKIMAMHPKRVTRSVVTVFDVRTLCLGVGPQHRSIPSRPTYLTVGDRLVALLDECSSELLEPHPSRSWHELQRTPFRPQDFTSHAVNPHGRTVFVSVETGATYSLDTSSRYNRWRLHGEWKLPLAGRAHFDPSLNDWVGLSGDPDTLGYLCSCDVVPSTGPDSGSRPPAWKLSKEKLFREDLQTEKHIGASFVCVGAGRVCLAHYYFSVEDDVSRSAEDLTRSGTGMLRLTTFALKYNKNGDPCAEAQCPVRCYRLLTKASKKKNLVLDDDPVAFWI